MSLPAANVVPAVQALRRMRATAATSHPLPRMLFFVFGFPPDFSGATLQTIELARALRHRGVKSSFLAETYDPTRSMSFEHDGFAVDRILRHGDRSIHRFGAALAAAIFARRDEFDALWFNGNPGEFWTTAYATAAAHALGKRVFVELNMEFYESDPLRIRGTRLEGLKRWIGGKVERYLPNSGAILRSFPTDMVGERAELLPYGVDLERFHPASSADEKRALRERLGLPQDRPIVCAVGAVTRRKNPDFVLRAWRRVCERLGDRAPLLAWLGPLMTEDREHHDGAWVRELVASSEQGALRGNVKFVGNVEKPEFHLRAADGFVFASRQEGSPSVVREALASGLPIVALELPGITDELLTDGRDGFVVPVQDRARFQAWADKTFDEEPATSLFTDRVVALLADGELARTIGARAHDTAVRKFSIQARAQRVVELLARSEGKS